MNNSVMELRYGSLTHRADLVQAHFIQGYSVSESINIAGYISLSLHFPDEWDGAELTILVSPFPTGPFHELQYGVKQSSSIKVAKGRGIAVTGELASALACCSYICLQSSIPQSIDRTITIVLRT